MVRDRDRCRSASPAPARRRPGRSLRPADAARAAPAAADAGPRQPALPAALPGHGRHGADAPSRPLRRRPGARLGSGRWHVLADHTEVPSGIGYALEMRRVLARSLPEAFRLHPGAAISGPSSTAGTIAARHGARRRAQPNMAVLTPGSLSATYLRACLSLAHARRAAGRGRRSRGARRRGVDRPWPACAPSACCCAASTAPSSIAPLELRADLALGVTGMVRASAQRQDHARRTRWARAWSRRRR